MKNRNRQLIFAAFLFSLFIAGCGPANEPVAGIDRGGLQGGGVGSVSGFGSVIVNGTHYETGSAAISVNGVQSTEDELEVGYVVVIQADFSGSGAQARVVDFSHSVIGPLTSVQ